MCADTASLDRLAECRVQECLLTAAHDVQVLRYSICL